MDLEEWRVVDDWSGIYKVSSQGRVRSQNRKYHPGRELKPQKSPQGHLFVVLSDGGRKIRKSVHRLVAQAFIDNPRGHPFVLHRDDDGGNNARENLRWGTPSDNILDMVRNGNHVNAKKTHCPKGHEFTPSGTYVRSDTGARRCRICTLAQNELGKTERRLSSHM